MLPAEALYDWDAMCDALAGAGAVVGARHRARLPRRARSAGWSASWCGASTGRSLGTYFRDEIAGPLGLDLHIGLRRRRAPSRRRDERRSRPTRSIPTRIGLAQVILSDPQSMAALRVHESAVDGARPEQPEWRRAGDSRRERPRRSARAGARVRRAGARRRRRRRARARTRRASRAAPPSSRTGRTSCCRSPRASASASCCRRIGPTRASAPASAPSAIPAPAARSASPTPTTAIGFGYVMNRMGPHILLDPRAIALIDATYESIGRRVADRVIPSLAHRESTQRRRGAK